MGFYRFLNYITNEILSSKQLMNAFLLFGTLVLLLEIIIGPPWTKEDYYPSMFRKYQTHPEFKEKPLHLSK